MLTAAMTSLYRFPSVALRSACQVSAGRLFGSTASVASQRVAVVRKETGCDHVTK